MQHIVYCSTYWLLFRELTTLSCVYLKNLIHMTDLTIYLIVFYNVINK